MTDLPGVLIYDGDCQFCSAAATVLRHLPEAGYVPWLDEPAQSFLKAQNGEAPFALVFVDEDRGRVYPGRDAARELCERAGLSVLLQDVVDDNHERMASAISTITGLDRDPDLYHGVYPLAADAEAAFEDLAVSTCLARSS